VHELLTCANRSAGNADDAPAIEVLGQLVVRTTADIVIATDRTPARTLHANEELTVASEPLRCTYLAIAGGVAAPRILDGYGALLCAGLGAPLRSGDTLVAGTHGAATAAPESFT